MKTGEFAIYQAETNPVIVAIMENCGETETAEKFYLVKKIQSKIGNQEIEQFQASESELIPFTHSTASVVLDEINKKISNLNIKKHIINDCLNYI